MPVRMRFPLQAFEELKQEDPNTQISLNYIRSLAASGKIPVVLVGRRRLINYDAMLDYLAKPIYEDGNVIDYGKIRRISG